jgi:5-methylcytosine-specific restriction endonuclease McrA
MALTTTQKKRLRSPHQPVGRWIRVEKRLSIYIRDKFRCLLCGEKFSSDKLSLDHIIPKSKGGSNHQTNLYTASLICNSRRGDKPLEKFAEKKSIIRVERAIQKPIFNPITGKQYK